MNERTGFRILPSFALKIIAILFMTLDHVGLFLMSYSRNPDYIGLNQPGYWMRCFGRIALPLFLFMLAEGMRHTHSKWKYIGRLGAICLPILLAQIIDKYALGSLIGFGEFSNIFIDLCLGALTLALLQEKGLRKLYALIPIAYVGLSYGVTIFERYNDLSVVWLPEMIRSPYGMYGLLLVIAFYYSSDIVYLIAKSTINEMGISRDEFEKGQGRGPINALSGSFLFLINLAFWGLSLISVGKANLHPWDDLMMSVQAWSILAIPFILMYNGKRGYDSKPFRIVTYLYFVVHLVIIFAVFRLSFGY